MVPSHTTLPSTWAIPRRRPIRCAAEYERLDHDLITRVDRTPIANALDAHEVNQLLAVLGLRQITAISPTCATASVRIVGGRAGWSLPQAVRVPLVQRNVLDTDDPLVRLEFGDAIDEQKGVAMRQDPPDDRVVQW